MSFAEKQALSENISTLSAEHLGKIIDIIQSKNPRLAQQTPGFIYFFTPLLIQNFMKLI